MICYKFKLLLTKGLAIKPTAWTSSIYLIWPRNAICHYWFWQRLVSSYWIVPDHCPNPQMCCIWAAISWGKICNNSSCAHHFVYWPWAHRSWNSANLQILQSNFILFFWSFVFSYQMNLISLIISHLQCELLGNASEQNIRSFSQNMTSQWFLKISPWTENISFSIAHDTHLDISCVTVILVHSGQSSNHPHIHQDEFTDRKRGGFIRPF